MEVGEAIVSVGDSPVLGPPRITLNQPLPTVKQSLPVVELKLIRQELALIRNLLSLIEQNTRPTAPRSLWERIKSWLGIHAAAAT